MEQTPPPPPPPPVNFSGDDSSKGKAVNNSTTNGGNSEKMKMRKKKLASPRELVSHYESQGMGTQEASLKVIEDLQNVLFRVVTSNNNKQKLRSDSPPESISSTTSRKLDVINSRLIQLDMKVDSKPGYPQTLAIGVASGALLSGIGNAWPHIAVAVGQIWNAVRRVTAPPDSSSS